MRGADLASGRRGNVEISFAYQQRAEFGLVKGAKELCKPEGSLILRRF
jgi:hypothetical protein